MTLKAIEKRVLEIIELYRVEEGTNTVLIIAIQHIKDIYE